MYLIGLPRVHHLNPKDLALHEVLGRIDVLSGRSLIHKPGFAVLRLALNHKAAWHDPFNELAVTITPKLDELALEFHVLRATRPTKRKNRLEDVGPWRFCRSRIRPNIECHGVVERVFRHSMPLVIWIVQHRNFAGDLNPP